MKAIHAPHVAGQPQGNGKAISSSWTIPGQRLPARWGYRQMGNTPSASVKIIFKAHEQLRHELASPVGLVITSPSDYKDALVGSSFLVSIGDVVTLDLLDIGCVPDISIVDYKTKRMPIAEVKARLRNYPQEEISVRNPAGVITQELWDAILNGFQKPRKLRIVVEGEEDLASLACISLAPLGAMVVYGIPGKGASFNRVDAGLKRLVNDALDKMRA